LQRPSCTLPDHSSSRSAGSRGPASPRWLGALRLP
jgi:hypothetical protein